MILEREYVEEFAYNRYLCYIIKIRKDFEKDVESLKWLIENLQERENVNSVSPNFWVKDKGYKRMLLRAFHCLWQPCRSPPTKVWGGMRLDQGWSSGSSSTAEEGEAGSRGNREESDWKCPQRSGLLCMGWSTRVLVLLGPRCSCIIPIFGFRISWVF